MGVEERAVNEHKVRRSTKQRSFLLKIIKESAEHLDASEIYKIAMQEMPRISLATVYRNLHILKEKGLINEVRIDESHHHYEVKTSKEHYHIICRNCGVVEEFEFPIIKTINKSVKKLEDFEIIDAEVKLTGYCKKCRKKANSKKDKK